MAADWEQGRDSPVLLYLLAGIETGVLGGLVALAWLVLGSYWTGQPVWTVPAAFGSALRGDPVLHRGFNSTALAGVALQFSITGILGALFGLVVREGTRFRRVLILSLLAGLAGYQFCHAVVFGRAWLPPVFPAVERSTLTAWIVFGLFLSVYPRLLRSIRQKLVLQG